MEQPNPATVLKALSEIVALGHELGLSDHVRRLEKLQTEIEAKPATLKVLRSRIGPLLDETNMPFRQRICGEDLFGDPFPGMEERAKRRKQLLSQINDLLHPLEPEWPETDISKFTGSEFVKEKLVSYKGDPKGVQPVVEGTIALVRRYSELVGAGDFEGAYALTDVGLRAWMNFRTFLSDHARAAKQYQGPASEFLFNQFAYIYADSAKRQQSNTAEEGWPKLTRKENRRGRVLGFWVRDRGARTGSGGALWIAEEAAGYRIAKFDFCRP